MERMGGPMIPIMRPPYYHYECRLHHAQSRLSLSSSHINFAWEAETKDHCALYLKNEQVYKLRWSSRITDISW